MRITPGPGTVVVIVHRSGEENVPRVGRMTGRAGAISAEARPDLPPLAPAAFVVLLAKVANQKMMAEGAYAGERDGYDNFVITRGWAPSDNRRDPRLPVRVKCEVRTRGSRSNLPAVICDLSAGGAKIEVESDALRGEVELLVRYGGFSATLPAYVLGYDDEEDELDLLENASEGESSGDVESASADGDASENSDESGPMDPAEASDEATTEDETSMDEQLPGGDATAELETSDQSEAEVTPVEEAPGPASKRRRLEKIVQPTVEVRLMFDDLDLPQQGFLRHMLRDVAEISGWELAS